MSAASTSNRPFASRTMTLYMLREVLPSFLAGTTIFLFIMLMFQVMRISEFLVSQQVSVFDMGRLSYGMLLSFIPIAIPVAFLFSVLMGVSRASSENEIMALQASGYSLRQICRPLVVLATIVSAFCVYASLFLVPQGNRSFELLFTKLANERVMAALKPGVFVDGFYGLVIFSEQVIPIRNEMKRVFIFDEREEKHPLFITAESGILRRAPERGILTLRLNNGSIHVEKPAPSGIQQKIDFDLYDINLELAASGEAWRDYSPTSYNYTQLKQRLAETIPDPPRHRQLLVELHRRFSLSFSCLVFAFLGFAIGIGAQRGVRSTAVVICLLVGMIYWLSYVAANALALTGFLPPWLGIWIPNFLFLGLAYLIVFLRTPRPRPGRVASS